MSKPRGKARMRRSYLKQFSSEVINTGHSVNIFRMRDSPAFNYTQRARGLGLDEKFLATLNRLFGFPVRTEPHQVSQQRQACLDKIKEMQRRQPGNRYVQLVRGKHHVEKLFFNETLTLWWIIEERWFPRALISVSITYGSRERVLTLRARGQIRWKEKYTPEMRSTSNGDKGL